MNLHARTPLEVADLHKSFADVGAVRGVDLRVEPGEILALVGPSGCGKSTLLRMVAGLAPADSGSIQIAGQLVEDGRSRVAPERRSVGLVFQDHALFPHLSVNDNIAFGLRDLAKSQHSDRVAEMLEMVGLPGFGSRFPHELSGGERQRVALARALAPRPGLMLFDEPFASLDHNLRVQLRADILSALRSTNTAAVIVTHDQREALAVGDRIAVMRSGRVEQLGTPADVFHTPADRFVAAFMGDVSFLPITETSGSVGTVLGPVPSAKPGKDAWAMVRPDDVEFTPTEGGSATVIGAEYSGFAWTATAAASDGSTVSFMRSHLHPPTVGERGELQLASGHQQVVVAE